MMMKEVFYFTGAILLVFCVVGCATGDDKQKKAEEEAKEEADKESKDDEATGPKAEVRSVAEAPPKVDLMGVGKDVPEDNYEIKQRFKRATDTRRVSGAEGVHLFEGEIPEGITISEGTLHSQEGYDHRVIARFQMFPPFSGGYPADDKEELEARISHLAEAAEANAVVLDFYVDDDLINGVGGFLLRLDPESDPDETEAMDRRIKRM